MRRREIDAADTQHGARCLNRASTAKSGRATPATPSGWTRRRDKSGATRGSREGIARGPHGDATALGCRVCVSFIVRRGWVVVRIDAERRHLIWVVYRSVFRGLATHRYRSVQILISSKWPTSQRKVTIDMNQEGPGLLIPLKMQCRPAAYLTDNRGG